MLVQIFRGPAQKTGTQNTVRVHSFRDQKMCSLPENSVHFRQHVVNLNVNAFICLFGHAHDRARGLPTVDATWQGKIVFCKRGSRLKKLAGTRSSDTIQYSLSQSQTDRCESEIYKYNSIANRQLPRRTVLLKIFVRYGQISDRGYSECSTFRFSPKMPPKWWIFSAPKFCILAEICLTE